MTRWFGTALCAMSMCVSAPAGASTPDPGTAAACTNVVFTQTAGDGVFKSTAFCRRLGVIFVPSLSLELRPVRRTLSACPYTFAGTLTIDNRTTTAATLTLLADHTTTSPDAVGAGYLELGTGDPAAPITTDAHGSAATGSPEFCTPGGFEAAGGPDRITAPVITITYAGAPEVPAAPLPETAPDPLPDAPPPCGAGDLGVTQPACVAEPVACDAPQVGVKPDCVDVPGVPPVPDTATHRCTATFSVGFKKTSEAIGGNGLANCESRASGLAAGTEPSRSTTATLTLAGSWHASAPQQGVCTAGELTGSISLMSSDGGPNTATTYSLKTALPDAGAGIFQIAAMEPNRATLTPDSGTCLPANPGRVSGQHGVHHRWWVRLTPLALQRAERQRSEVAVRQPLHVSDVGRVAR